METRKVSVGGTVLGLTLLGLGLLAGRLEAQTNQPLASSVTNAPISAESTSNAPATTTSTPLPPAPAVVGVPPSTPVPQSVAPVAPAAPAVPEVRLSKGASDVARFAQGGISDDVMLAYISNSTGKFNLGSDQIVYLNDLGVSGNVIKEMIQRDTVLDAMAQDYANSLNQPQPPVVPPVDYSTNPPPQVVEDPQMPPPDPNSYLPNDDVDYFYGSLAPYGTWFVEPGVGFCWQPTVWVGNHDWRPYCDRGRWIYSDCGWYWESDYSWGWAPFHYGRWFNAPNHGWVWSPDRHWGPAWVSWRTSGEYCGWAPLPPGARYVAGRGLIAAAAVRPGGLEFGLRAENYTFIPIARMSDYAPSRYAERPWQADDIRSQTKLVTQVGEQNHRVVMAGVDPNLVARLAGTQIRRAEIREVSNTSGHGQPDRMAKRDGSLVIYRSGLPETQPQPGAVRNPAPASRPAPTRNSGSGQQGYPHGSLVIHGDTVVSQPAQRPLPNMNLSYLAHQPQTPTIAESESTTIRPTYSYSQNSYGQERQPHQSDYTVMHGFASPAGSINSPGPGVSVTSVHGSYTAAQHFSSSSSPYQVFSSSSRVPGSGRNENNSYNIPGHYTVAGRLTPSNTTRHESESSSTWRHESDHSFSSEHSHHDSPPPMEVHNHVESHISESHISESHVSYSAPAPAHSSGGGSSPGRK